jgi:flavin-dependent dehydrogenase
MDESFLNTPRHAVAVIGGACAGAEAAEILAQAGIYTVVIDQNTRPFGKIEDGLPRWHARQRQGEYKKIGDKLKTPGIDFLPTT